MPPEELNTKNNPPTINQIGGLISITIDGIPVKVPLQTTILEAANLIGVRIPTLCHHTDLKPAGVCRICVVEIEGQRTLQSACTYPITAPLNIKTWSPDIRRTRRLILDLLLADHIGNCYTCQRNNNCELQKLAAEYGVDMFRFDHATKSRFEIQDDGPIIRDMNKCIVCGRCVRTCQNLQSVGAIDVHGRGDNVHISTFMDYPLLSALCVACGQCANRCPTGALTEHDDTDKVWAEIENPKKHVVIQTAPAPRAGIGEAFGLQAGTPVTGQLNTALKRIGFDKVFDTNFTADLTIMEEGTELLLRLKSAIVEKKPVALPQLTSCCPAWIKFIEHVAPDCLKYLSTCKSPQQMFGAVIKTYYAQKQGINPADIVSVSLMPCTAKKFECGRSEMNISSLIDVDYALTTREIAKMIKEAGVDLPHLPTSDFDDPLGLGSGAGVIFGNTGGVMEAAIRTAYELVTGEEVPFESLRVTPVRGMDWMRTAELPIKKAVPAWQFLAGATLKVMIVHGLSNARKMLDMLKAGELQDYHFIEVMCCPGGCIGGGGQPIPTSLDIRKARTNGIFSEDERMPVRKSHLNPIIKKIYEEFFTEGPCGHKSHTLLHTHYLARGKKIGEPVNTTHPSC